MEPISLGIGLALSAAGAFTSLQGAKKSSAATQAALAAQGHAEAIREQAMEVDADRRRRAMARQAVIQRSQALAVASSQGAINSSGLQGAYGQVAGEYAFGMEGVNVNEQLGHEMFAANRDLLAARKDSASAQSEQALGGALSSLGGAVINNMDKISRLGNTYGPSAMGGLAFNAYRGQVGNTSLLGNSFT